MFYTIDTTWIRQITFGFQSVDRKLWFYSQGAEYVRRIQIAVYPS